MLVPDRNHKIEKAVSTDETRPILTRPYVRIVDGQGYLCATDSYQLVMIPVEIVEGDVEGALPLPALKAARRSSWNGTIALQQDAAVVSGLVEFAGGEARYARPEGKFPDVFALRAALLEAPVIASVGLNALMLAKVQAALGADRTGVELEIRHPLKAILVRPLGRSGVQENAGTGMVMPIRIDKR